VRLTDVSLVGLEIGIVLAEVGDHEAVRVQARLDEFEPGWK
jgi:hypothetical protein